MAKSSTIVIKFDGEYESYFLGFFYDCTKTKICMTGSLGCAVRYGLDDLEDCFGDMYSLRALGHTVSIYNTLTQRKVFTCDI